MRSFARYIQKDNYPYRLNTILQFGKSWDLLGNIVLANPGSAKPQCKLSNEYKNNLEKFFLYYHNQKLDLNEWYVFKDDPTMRYVEKLFSGFYTHSSIRNLNGVIQLFNCFNVINPKLDEAIKNINNYDKQLCFDTNIVRYFYDKPVYFGFSQVVLKSEQLSSKARDIFNKTPLKLRAVFDGDFCKNKFYHLGYINRAYKTKAKDYVKCVLLPFVDTIKCQE